jgi:hypothetical protein
LIEAEEPGAKQDAFAVLASVKQGDTLRRLAKALDIPINPEWDGKLIQTDAAGAPFTTNVEGVEFIVLGPHHAELAALQEAHDEWLRTRPKSQRTEAAFLAALDDKSVANLSSIVFLAKSADQKTILLTGDARADKIQVGLELAGLSDAQGGFEVDILKMPHHGSIRNIDENFVRNVTARDYVFSGNGEHSNPDRETFELLLAERRGAAMNFFLTYTISDIDRVRKAKAHGPWTHAADSLAAVLQPSPPDVAVIEHSGQTMIL